MITEELEKINDGAQVILRKNNNKELEINKKELEKDYEHKRNNK